MASTPAVTVVMPVHNAEKYVAESIDSILGQTFQDFDFAIIDDGSTDGSLQIAEDYAKKDRRIRLMSRPNTGIVGALNDGLALSAGRYIARMDADDIALPDRLQRQVDFLEAHPDHVAAGCGLLCIDEDGDPLYMERWAADHEEIEARLLVGAGGLPHPSAVMRAADVKRQGGYRRRFQWVEDLDLWLRLSEVGRLANLPDVLLKYRLHAGSVCWRKEEDQRRLVEQLLREARRRRGLPPPPIQPPRPVADVESPDFQRGREAYRAYQWIDRALAEGFRRTARKYALRLLAERPLKLRNWRILCKTLSWLPDGRPRRAA